MSVIPMPYQHHMRHIREDHGVVLDVITEDGARDLHARLHGGNPAHEADEHFHLVPTVTTAPRSPR